MPVTQISRAETVAIPNQPSLRLRPDAADAWQRAEAAFGKKVLAAGGGIREEKCAPGTCKICQYDLWMDRYVKGDHRGKAGYSNEIKYWCGKLRCTCKTQPWTKKAGKATAAVPGTSNHGGGIAVDVQTARYASDSRAGNVVFTSFNDPDRLRWLQIAKEHGWSDDEGRPIKEWWHMTYYPERDKHRNATTGKITGGTLKNETAAVAAATPKTLDLRNADKKPVTGHDVEILQAALRKHGYDIKVDGYAGLVTKMALGSFQRAKNLDIDYVAGPASWRALLGAA